MRRRSERWRPAPPPARRRMQTKPRQAPAGPSTEGPPMNDTSLTVTGNLVDDPELRFTPSGVAVARFRIASTPRYRDNATGEWKDGDTLFLTCQVWRQAAGNAAWRHAVPDLPGMAPGRRDPPEGDADDRHRPPPSALLRDLGRREAHRLRAPGRRGGRVAPQRHRQGHQGHPHRKRPGRGRGRGLRQLQRRAAVLTPG